MARQPSLRRTLLAWLLVPLLTLLAAGAAVGYFFAGNLAQSVYDRELLEVATELSLHLGVSDGRPRLDLTQAAERILLFDQDDTVRFRVTDGRGQSIAGDAALPLPTLAAAPKGLTRPARADTPAMLATPRYGWFDLDGVRYRNVVLAAAVPGLADPRGVLIEVAETTTKRGGLTGDILLGIVGPQLLLILLAGALVWFGVAHGLRPLGLLRQALQDRSHRDLAVIPMAGVPREVQPLVGAVNELMLRLDHVLGQQSRFIADAAHQLRTPVAGIKASLELALREKDHAQLQRALGASYVGVERLSRLVGQLLTLARNEPESVRNRNFAVIDLNKTIFTATMDWVPEALKKDIDLGFEAPDGPVLVEGDPVRLVELANNLIDNAIRYSPTGGRATVRVTDDPSPAFSVSDDGPTIPLAERERVFERFHRLLGTKTDGSGLGLAIVREIATIHGAKVMLTDDTDGVGNRFAVVFPRLENRPPAG